MPGVPSNPTTHCWHSTRNTIFWTGAELPHLCPLRLIFTPGNCIYEVITFFYYIALLTSLWICDCFLEIIDTPHKNLHSLSFRSENKKCWWPNVASAPPKKSQNQYHKFFQICRNPMKHGCPTAVPTLLMEQVSIHLTLLMSLHFFKDCPPNSTPFPIYDHIRTVFQLKAPNTPGVVVSTQQPVFDRKTECPIWNAA